MRIRNKIVLCAIAVTVAALALSTTLLILFIRQTTLDAIRTAAVADTENFASFFSRNREDDIQTSRLLGRTFGLYRFRKLSMHGSFTLHDGEEYLYNSYGFEPESITGWTVPVDEFGEPTGECMFGRFEGRIYAFTTRNAQLDGRQYTISLVRDVTDSFAQLDRIAWICVGLSFGVAMAAAAVTWLAVRGILLPIESLRKTASEIAAGEYGKRIPIRGKDEFALLAADFNAMASSIERNTEALRERNERQEMFINDLSHELKTPVTSILLNTETLLGRRVSQEEQIELLSRIQNQGRWLERLSQKLMTLVMLKGSIACTPVSIGDVIRSVEETIRPAVEQSGIRFDVQTDETVLPMDADLVRSALLNLVENARRACSPGAAITLEAKARSVFVTDTGRGIPEAELKRITEPFYMVDRSRSKRNGGSGLGLALVKEIAEAHHALLLIESTEGVGTRIGMHFLA